jgi:hypothetical protein
LTVLPWEFLYDPDRDEYLCFSRDTPIVRYTDLRQPISRLTVEPPLRILGMVASPRDLDPLDVEHEKGLMEEAIEDLQAGGLVKLTWLEGETWRDLQRAMRRDGPWHIFHFVGHGDFDLAAQEGLIAFAEKGTGRRHLLRSRDLARLLDGHPSLRLVFLNSCEGARGSEGDPVSGTAATLVRRGIPAVVAMQYQITDKAAIEFSSAFYESLADGLPVDAAVTEARVAVSMDSMLEWGTPVLYMRSPDGRLFDMSAETRRTELPMEIPGREEALRQYREDIESIWADRQLNRSEVGWLDDHIKELGLSVSNASTIEREVMGETKEAILERQERSAEEQVVEERTAAKEQYHNAVEEAWADNHLSGGDTQRLGALVSQLNLSRDTAVSIERDVMGDTKEAILERQELAAREREQLDELYARARRSHQDQDWQKVVDIFQQIRAEDPAYPDSEGLLALAREALEAQELARRVAALYAEGQRHMNAKEWQQALECFEEVQQLEPGYRDTETLLSQAHQELAPPTTVEVPDLSGQEVSQANSQLAGRGLKLGARSEAPSDTVSKGRIIEQRPVSGTKVEAGNSVDVKVSSGPSTVEVPVLLGKSHDEARNILDTAGLRLGTVGKVPSDEVAEDHVVEQYPASGSKVERGTSLRVTVAHRQNEELAVERAAKRRVFPKPASLPDESELRLEAESSSQRSEKSPSDRERKAERPQDLPD